MKSSDVKFYYDKVVTQDCQVALILKVERHQMIIDYQSRKSRDSVSESIVPFHLCAISSVREREQQQSQYLSDQ